MHLNPDRVGPSLILFLTRWAEMIDLEDAIEADDSLPGLSPEDAHCARAVVALAGLQAQSLLHAVAQGAVRRLEPGLRVTAPSKLNAKIRNRWWTGAFGLRSRGATHRRDTARMVCDFGDGATLELRLIPAVKRRGISIEKQMEQIARLSSKNTDVTDDEDFGRCLRLRVELSDGMPIADAVAKAEAWVGEVLLPHWKRLEGAVLAG